MAGTEQGREKGKKQSLKGKVEDTKKYDTNRADRYQL